ncbi:hypothetical protein AQUCO_02500110v1, partial [Aquilegia coerulea]
SNKLFAEISILSFFFFYLIIQMDLLRLLILLPLFFLQIRAEDSGSIVFIDGPKHQFLRIPSSDGLAETSSMSLTDVGASISVLLGFNPPSSLSEDSSAKLNEVLSPNPFNRPRAVLMLEVGGMEGDQQLLMDHLANSQVGSTIRRKVLFGSGKAEIQLSGQDEISVIALDEASECDAVCMDKQLRELASWLGGSYVSSSEELLDGELTANLASGRSLNLHMSKKADREFILSIVSLIRNIRRAMEMHEGLSQSMNNPAELMIGSFSGLKEKYGHEDVSQQGVELFLATLTKLFDLLQDAYQGQIVGVVYFNVKPNVEFGSISNVNLASRPSPRWLGEAVNSSASTIIEEIVLVRRTLAVITGIILLLSTFLGIYFLLNMPLTRDTLLYSNVKLD